MNVYAAPTPAEPANDNAGVRVSQWLARHGHFALAALVTGVVATIVLPVAPVVLDLLIAFNISFSVLLLMLAIYVPGALGMSTFPSLIVLTTVLRLSLNIASTKQILLHAHAGNIIETFGRLVMGGQVVVGLVVFAIIAVVQFIVISKGAERVAEVGARFTLDAMPGKQMSIEADLRGGFIDKHEAKRLRSLLEQESHMHGSMDGAMKFVKGDAIAAILIALVNIIGGISIGAGLMGMAIGDAVARYTLLSIGDGMVSQIPSLLTSVAAGVLTTRVAGLEGSRRDLASQIGRQVVAQPMALFAAAVVVFGFVLVPGFPKLPFALIGVGCSVLGWRALRQQRRVPTFDRVGPAASHGAADDSGTASSLDPVVVAPLVLRIASDLRGSISPVRLQQALDLERSQLQHDLGLSFPALQVRFDPQLTGSAYALDVQEIPARRGLLSGDPGADDTAESEVLLAHEVASVVRLRPDAFVGTQEINDLIKRAQAQLPDLSEEVTRGLPMPRIAEVLRRLAAEGISLRYLREIYESLLTWGPREKDAAMLCEYVRIDLGRFICHRLIDAERQLHAITVESGTEAQLRAAIQQGPSGAFLALAPDAARDLIGSAEAAVRAMPPAHPPVLLSTLETRRFLRRLLAKRLPQLHVLSYPELSPDLQIVSVGRVGLPRSAALRAVSE